MVSAGTTGVAASAKAGSSEDLIITVDNVHKSYLLGVEAIPALRGVSLSIRRGPFGVLCCALALFQVSLHTQESLFVSLALRVVERQRCSICWALSTSQVAATFIFAGRKSGTIRAIRFAPHHLVFFAVGP